MENNIINAFMQVFGYSQKINDLFSEWELVKDEILLPERKKGSGNGTIHVYLQRENIESLKKCFPNYVNNRLRGQNFQDEDCPHVIHYCLVSNLACAASVAYHSLKCDDSQFNIVEYLKELLAFEEKGMISFESIFKLASDNRPYFKHFNKKIFTNLIRSLFISGKSAYKISMYRNPNTSEIAAFWEIGSFVSDDLILSVEDLPQIKSDGPEIKIAEDRCSISGFIKFMKSKHLKPASIENYIYVLDNLLPRLIRTEMKVECCSLLQVTDYAKLLKLDSIVWKVPEINRYNISGQHQLSAALHKYMNYIQDQLTDQELAEILFKRHKN